MRVCLFDIDGTLISTGGAGRKALVQAMRSEFGVEEPEAVPTTGRTDRVIAQDLFHRHGLEDTPDHWERFRAGYLRNLPDVLEECDGKVLPGVPEILRRLASDKRVVLGLLTGNTEQGAHIKLDYYQVHGPFVLGAYGDLRRNRDDVARDALQLVRDQIDSAFDAARIWILGDTPWDVQCARAIGAKAVAVATGSHSAEELRPSAPDVLLDDLADPADFLDQCLAD